MINIAQQIWKFLESLDEPISQIEAKVGVSNGTLGKLKTGKGFNTNTLEKIYDYYDELNTRWVSRNKGEMTLSIEEQHNEVKLNVLQAKLEYMQEMVEISQKKAENSYKREIEETEKFTSKFLKMEQKIERLQKELNDKSQQIRTK